MADRLVPDAYGDMDAVEWGMLGAMDCLPAAFTEQIQQIVQFLAESDDTEALEKKDDVSTGFFRAQ